MLDFVKNEFEDKKLPKILVKGLQYYLTNPKKQSEHIGNLEVFDFEHHETFFGYYDRSPLNKSLTHCLFYRSKFTTKLNPRRNIPIELILWNLKEKEIVKIWKIWAYNWQQGSKVQWLSDDGFIFNNYDRKRNIYYSTIVNISNFEEKIIGLPSYDSSENYFLSLNFSRLAKYRPDYGYRNIKINDLNDKTDGIYYYDIIACQQKLLVSIDELKMCNWAESMEGAKHKVNHIMISPDGKLFMFMHRWITKEKKIDRLYVYNLTTQTYRCVVDNGMVSHCYWYRNSIVGYMNGPGNIPGYYIVDLETNKINLLSDKIQYFGDGHPSLFKDKILFDTYPLKNRLKYLYIYDLNSDQLTNVGKFLESVGYECQCRCDLHPRFVNESLLSFDSTHVGKRCFCLLKL